MSRADFERMAALQDAYIAEQEMLLIEGYIGSDPAERTGARLYVEAANANIAGMQQQLYFPLDDEDVHAGADGHLHAQPGGGGLSRPTA